MTLNVHSIRFKLLATGLLSVLLPLIIVGYFSVTKSSSALMILSQEKVQTMASDLGVLVKNLLHTEIDLAKLVAIEHGVVTGMEKIQLNTTNTKEETAQYLFASLRNTFSVINEAQQYQGIFAADASGEVITGVLENGEEYTGISISNNAEFIQAKESGKPIVGEMIRSQTTSQLIVPVVAPIYAQNDQFLGIVGLVLKADYFTRLIAERKVGQTGYAYMINSEGVIIAHPKTELLLQLNVKTVREMSDINTLMLGGNSGVAEYVYSGIRKIAGCAPAEINGWSIAVTQNADEFLDAAKQIRNIMLIVLLLAVIIAGTVLVITIGKIVRPIKAAAEGLKDIAQGEGDLTMRLQISSRDEVGELARWFNVFIDKLQHIIKDVSSGVHTLSTSSTELTQIAEQMNLGAQQASSKSNSVAAAAEEMSTNMQTMAAAMEQSTTNTNMVATASEEMTSTIGEIAHNAEKARCISDNAAKKANEASANINELGESAKSIGKVVETITEISEQVNLLALNATIEAARAGDAGKGFAVVANEIKDLAKQTAAATYDIKDKVGNIQNTTEKTVLQIIEINSVINNVHEVVGSIATAVEEQTAVTAEITGNVSQMAHGINEVNENVNQSSVVATGIAKEIVGVSAISQEMFNSSSQVSSSSHELSTLAEQLNQMVGQFKTE